MAVSKEQNTDVQSADSEINDEIVREYLKSHDDFLQRYPDMLDFLHVSHASGSAVSLVEKQVSVMRERSTELRQRLKALSANAKDNDALFEKTRTLVLKLLDANSVEALYSTFITSMASELPTAISPNCSVDPNGMMAAEPTPFPSEKRNMSSSFLSVLQMALWPRKREPISFFTLSWDAVRHPSVLSFLAYRIILACSTLKSAAIDVMKVL